MLSRRVLPNPAGGISRNVVPVQHSNPGSRSSGDRNLHCKYAAEGVCLVGQPRGGKGWRCRHVGGQGVGTTAGESSAIAARSSCDASPKWARLNNVAVLFEYEIDTQGILNQIIEWNRMALQEIWRRRRRH
jgi:hypothetical protein